jgi:hypothetical protein
MAAHCNRCGAAIGDLIIGDCIVSEEEAREFPRDVRCWAGDLPHVLARA